jgi:hypothetical protein
MIHAYVYYPKPKISTHHNPSCTAIQKMGKEEQRSVNINAKTITKELGCFSTDEYQFGSTAQVNDMWLVIDFDDADFEAAVLKYVQRLIGKRYSPLAGIKIEEHC